MHEEPAFSFAHIVVAFSAFVFVLRRKLLPAMALASDVQSQLEWDAAVVTATVGHRW